MGKGFHVPVFIVDDDAIKASIAILETPRMNGNKQSPGFINGWFGELLMRDGDGASDDIAA